MELSCAKGLCFSSSVEIAVDQFFIVKILNEMGFFEIFN